MADQENKKTGDTIGEKVSRGANAPGAKKRVVIKKKAVARKGDISEHFASGGPAKPARITDGQPAPTTTQPPSTRETTARPERGPAAESASQQPRRQSAASASGSERSTASAGTAASGPSTEKSPIIRSARNQPPVAKKSLSGYFKESEQRRSSSAAGRSQSPDAFAKAGTPFDKTLDTSQPPRGGYRGGQQGGPIGQGARRGPPGQPGQGGGYRGGPTSGTIGDRRPGGPGGAPFPGAAGGPPAAGTGDQRSRRAPTGRERDRGGRDRDFGGRDRDSNKFFRQADKRRHAAISGTTVPKLIEIMDNIQVGELAKKLNLKPNDVIARLMKMGEMVTINKTIDSETAILLAGEFGCEVKVVSLYDETVIEEELDKEEDREVRPPVVTIMGHVDHGKTRLLDTIRKSNVIATEAGAITQHIGAYQVLTPGGKITFLDTPGHEAFTAMRARGAAVTDIVILVVAANDGVKEQTKEAITHALEAKVPIIVAINKIDLPEANPDKVRQELSSFGLQPEEWGGSTIFCEISATQNTNIDQLLEMVLLQAEMLNLYANPKMRAVGHVIEAKIDAGKGPVATILIEKGSLREGDPYVVGVFAGRVRAMFDDLGRRLDVATPATPVEITGIDGVPEAGDPFSEVENDKYAREIAAKRQHYKQIKDAADRVQPSLTNLQSWLSISTEVKVILKADVQGSVEAIRDGLLKLSTEEVQVRVIHGATGAISESDVTLAAASNAIIIGFQVRATPRALDLAEKSRVDIKYYSIIYDVIDDVKSAMEGMLEPDKVEEVLGHAEIRQVFRISRVGTIAGCMVTNGKIHRNNRIRVLRDNIVIHTGGIKGIKRVKDDVSEIAEGFECGIMLSSYNDINEGDVIEAFEVKEVARTLS